VAAAAQVLNVLSDYSLLLAIVTSAAILAGLIMIRSPGDAARRV